MVAAELPAGWFLENAWLIPVIPGVAFALMHGNVDGQVFALYVIAVAAAEVGVGLGMVLLVYRNRRSIALDELSEMKG